MNFLMKCQSHLINKSKSIIHNEINIKSKFLKRKRLDINQSNSLEFTTQNHCARTNPAPLNRKIQMKKNIIHNISNDLDRSTFQKFDNTKQMVHDERIINLESHLNLPIAKPVAISERIKRIEDRLIEIESQFPTFAAFYFDQESKNSNTTESHFFESKIQNPHSRVDSIQVIGLLFDSS
ncbi:hypothetical protein BC833DRAFT_583592 [Globomyces pollinis-pini]|nr:hypothetical protein BC833DRAFT_583592 [Globomyces pollinis-pini]